MGLVAGLSTSMNEVFTLAYKSGQWHHGSGSGSSPANTTGYRAFLAAYMRKHQIRSVLDIGCGDWQFSQFIDWGHIRYLGVDIVPGIVARNQARFGHWPSPRFRTGDVLDGYRMPGADLVLCKDLLQHWPDAAIAELGTRLGGRRALLTYDLGTGPHEDTVPGGYRPLDLTRPPFSWPAREQLRYESVSHEGRVRRVKVVMELTP